MLKFELSRAFKQVAVPDDGPRASGFEAPSAPDRIARLRSRLGLRLWLG